MHDPTRDSSTSSRSGDPNDVLPSWARELLAEPMVSRDEARAAIMQCVRHERRPAIRLSAPMRASRWKRRGLLTPFGAAALAGVLGILLSVRSIGDIGGGRSLSVMTVSAVVIGDTVMPSLRDTLRIVEFVLRGGDVRKASVVVDFNAWRQGTTELERRDDGAWHARVVVPRDVVRFAYVVNDEHDAGDHPRGTISNSTRNAPSAVMRARIDSI